MLVLLTVDCSSSGITLRAYGYRNIGSTSHLRGAGFGKAPGIRKKKRPGSARNEVVGGFPRRPDVHEHRHVSCSLGGAIPQPSSGYRETRDLPLGTNQSLTSRDCLRHRLRNTNVQISSSIPKQTEETKRTPPSLFGSC